LNILFFIRTDYFFGVPFCLFGERKDIRSVKITLSKISTWQAWPVKQILMVIEPLYWFLG